MGESGTALGSGSTPDVMQPWSTPDQAVMRGIFPGATYSPNAPKAYAQIEKAFDTRLQDVKTEASRIMNSPQYAINPQAFAKDLNAKTQQIAKLEEAKTLQLSKLILGN